MSLQTPSDRRKGVMFLPQPTPWVYRKAISGHRPSFAMKANYAVKGELCHGGSPLLANYRPTYDSQVYRILTEVYQYAGAVGCDSFAMGCGVENPISPRHPPVGGSSTGCAIVVADGQVEFAVASSTGGSATMPAVQMGLYSYQGSRGAISRYGLFAYHQYFDRPAVISKNPELLQVVAEQLVKNRGLKDPFQGRWRLQQGSLRTVYLYQRDGTHQADVKQRFQRAGYHCILVKPPLADIQRYYQYQTAHYAYSNLNRFDGVRFNQSLYHGASASQRDTRRERYFTHTIHQRLARATGIYQQSLPPQWLGDAAIHAIVHPIKGTQQQLERQYIWYAFPNVYNYASLTVPYGPAAGLQLMVPTGYQARLWAIANSI